MQAAPPPSSDSLLPNATKGYLSVRNVPELGEAWGKTELARLLDDPVMKPFGDDLRQQVKDKLLKTQDKLALSWEDLDGLATGDTLHPVQQAFCDRDALMCGFCTPGFVVATVAVLEKHPNATREQITKGLDGNICRCGTFVRVMEAALKARIPQSASASASARASACASASAIRNPQSALELSRG